MGFFALDDVIQAFKNGKLTELIADYDLNDLAFMKHELEGFARKHNRTDELAPLVAALAKSIQDREGR